MCINAILYTSVYTLGCVQYFVHTCVHTWRDLYTLEHGYFKIGTCLTTWRRLKEKTPLFLKMWRTLKKTIISIDFSASDDLIACLQEDDRIDFLDILNNNIYYNLKLDTQQDDENIIKFIDNYSFIMGSINGNLYHHQLK